MARCAAGIVANAYYFQLITALARHFDFDIETPWDELHEESSADAAVRQRRTSEVEFRYLQWPGRHDPKRQHPLRRHHSQPRTSLPGNRIDYGPRGAREVSRLATGPARMCEARASIAQRAQCLRQHALSLPQVARLSVGATPGIVLRAQSAKAGGARSPRKIVKEIANRLRLPRRRRPRLPDARSQRRNRCRAAKRSASASPARLAPGWSASCTSSMSRRSACTSATTSACSARSTACATSATR